MTIVYTPHCKINVLVHTFAQKLVRTSMCVECFFVFESMTDEPKGLRLKLFLKSQYVEFLTILLKFSFMLRETL